MSSAMHKMKNALSGHHTTAKQQNSYSASEGNYLANASATEPRLAGDRDATLATGMPVNNTGVYSTNNEYTTGEAIAPNSSLAPTEPFTEVIDKQYVEVPQEQTMTSSTVRKNAPSAPATTVTKETTGPRGTTHTTLAKENATRYSEDVDTGETSQGGVDTFITRDTSAMAPKTQMVRDVPPPPAVSQTEYMQQPSNTQSATYSSMDPSTNYMVSDNLASQERTDFAADPVFEDEAGKSKFTKRAGPHKKDWLNRIDPRVDSDLDGSANMGMNQTTDSYGQPRLDSKFKGPTNAGPYDSTLANAADPDIDSELQTRGNRS